MLVGFALRVLRLDFQPLWWDEGYSVWFATHPAAQMVALTAQDIHPPLYYALLRGWIGLLNPGPVALRLFSVFAGVLVIPLIYVMGRRLFSARVAWLAAFFMAISPLHIYYSQEVRMYGLAMLLGMAAMLAAWAALEPGHREHKDKPGVEPLGGQPAASPTGQARKASTPGIRALLVYILLAAAALYTLYYAALIPLGLTVYAVLRSVLGPRAERLTGRALLGWLGAQAAVALLYLPWLLYAAPRLVPYVSQKVIADADRPLGPLVYLSRHLSAFTAGHMEGPLAAYWPFALLLLIPLGIGLYLYWSRGLGQDWSRGFSRSVTQGEKPPEGSTPVIYSQIMTRRAIGMLATVLVTALALGWLIGLRFPFFPPRGERLLLIVLPAFLLLAAAGADGLLHANRIAGYATVGLIGAVAGASLTAFYLEPRYPEDDYRSLIARTVEQGLPGDTVFAVYPWQVGYWRAYGHAGGPTAVLSPDATWGVPVMRALDDALADGRVFFPAHLALGGILERGVESYLAYRGTPFLNEWFGAGTRLSAWANAPPGESLDFAPIRFMLPGGDPLELSGVSAGTGPVQAANAVTPLTLSWTRPDAPPTLVVSVRLTDALGQIWAQHDYEPLGGLGLAAFPGDPKCATCTGQKDALTGPWRELDRLALLIPAGTPPGDYRVELVVRPAEGDRPLDAVAADGAPLGTSVPLIPLTVAPAEAALDPARLPIATRAETDMANGLRFLGHSADDAPAAPGEARKVNLFWQALAQPPEDAVAFVQLLDRNDQVVAGWEAPPGAAYPTSQWAPGTLIRTQAALRLPAGLADGRYRLIAGLYRAGDKSRVLAANGADHLQLTTLTVRDRPHEMTAPQPQYTADATFGGVARLVGYDLPEVGVTPGGELPVTLHWQALGATDRPYTVFVHLVDEAGNIWGYGDGEPGGGAFPTTGWLTGEYIADAHTVAVAADAPPGTYRLHVGLYDPTTGARLLTSEGANHVVLDVGVRVGGRIGDSD